MSHIDPFERAADCERALAHTSDPERRTILKNLRELWTSLGNERPFLNQADLAEQIARIDEIHARLGLPHTVMQ
jgi:hypothetical protein